MNFCDDSSKNSKHKIFIWWLLSLFAPECWPHTLWLDPMFWSYAVQCFSFTWSWNYKISPVFSVSSPPPSPTDKIIISPLADMLSWAVWFKFLLNKVIANTCLFILTSFSKQSASWKVLEICEMCALSTDSRKTYSVYVHWYLYTGSSSYSFDWGGGGRNWKDAISFFCCISLPKWKHYMKRCWVFSVHVHW